MEQLQTIDYTKDNPQLKILMDKVLSQNPFLLLGIYKKAEVPGSVETVNFQHSQENNTFHVATLTGMA